MKQFYLLLLSAILSVGLSSCYNNDPTETPIPVEILYSYPLQTYQYTKFENLPDDVKSGWQIVKDRTYIVRSYEEFPEFCVFSNPLTEDEINFDQYSIIVSFFKYFAPCYGSQNSFAFNPLDRNYIFNVSLKIEDIDDSQLSFAFYRAAIVVPKITNKQATATTTFYFR